MHRLQRLHNLSSLGIPTQRRVSIGNFILLVLNLQIYSFYEQHSIAKDNSPIWNQFWILNNIPLLKNFNIWKPFLNILILQSLLIVTFKNSGLIYFWPSHIYCWNVQTCFIKYWFDIIHPWYISIATYK